MATVPTSLFANPIKDELWFGTIHTSAPYHTLRSSKHRNWFLIYNLSGEAFFRHANGEFRSSPGDAVLILPHNSCSYGSQSLLRYSRFYSEFTPRDNWLKIIQWPEIGPGMRVARVKSSTTRQFIERSIKEALALTKEPQSWREEFSMNSIERILLACSSETEQAKQLDPRLCKALDFFHSCPSAQITLDTLAKYCGLSKSRLSYLFQKDLGAAPLKYFERMRISHACHLLRMTHDSVKGISEQAGFTDPYYFSKRFRHHIGKSPRQYRNLHK